MRNSQPTTRSDHAPQVGRRPKPDVAPASNRHSRQVPSDREITLTSTAVWHAVLQLPTATEAKPPSCFHTLCALSSHTRLAAEQMWGRILTLLDTTFASSGARKCLVGWGPSELDLCKSALFAPPSCKAKTWTCGTDPGQAAASILESARQVRANTRGWLVSSSIEPLSQIEQQGVGLQIQLYWSLYTHGERTQGLVSKLTYMLPL